MKQYLICTTKIHQWWFVTPVSYSENRVDAKDKNKSKDYILFTETIGKIYWKLYELQIFLVKFT